MSDDHVHGWEALKLLSVLVGKVVMGLVQWVPLKSYTKRIKDDVLVCDWHFVCLPSVSDRF